VFAISMLPAQASVGVGVQVNPVQLGTAAQAGGTYSLPAVEVANTGTQTEWISVRIQRLSRGAGQPVPPSWIHAGDVPLRLSPHRAARIPLRLTIPADARKGPYLSDIVITGSAVVAVGNTSFGAAAATKLEFRVVAARHGGLLPALPPWLRWAALIVALTVAGYVAFVRSGLRIRVERTATSPARVHRTGSPDA
jgi:hypothetical protein